MFVVLVIELLVVIFFVFKFIVNKELFLVVKVFLFLINFVLI